MNLIKINLLPWREQIEEKQKKSFQFVMVIGALAGVAASAFVWFFLDQIIGYQEGRNEALRNGIKELDVQIAKIKELDEKKKSFLERKQKVEELDNKRFEGARIIDTTNQLVPEGSYLLSIQSIGGSNENLSNAYSLVGKAISDNKVAMFMTALPSTGVFDTPQLVSINKTDNGQEFTITANLIEQKFTPRTSAQATVSTVGGDNPSASSAPDAASAAPNSASAVTE